VILVLRCFKEKTRVQQKKQYLSEKWLSAVQKKKDRPPPCSTEIDSRPGGSIVCAPKR